MVDLKYCQIEWTDGGCITTFPDGSIFESFPHDTNHYSVISHRCGYGDDILAYCREHDFFHSFCEEYFNNRHSPIMWALAHGGEVDQSIYEEIIVQTCQKWVRANERPIVGGVDWNAFKREALLLLNG